MGTFTMFSSSEGSNPMPNPRRFKILRSHNVVNKDISWAILEVYYPDCTTYKGKKILVYKNMTTYRICNYDRLDPHFTEGPITPFARFEPTKDGWEGALTLARA